MIKIIAWNIEAILNKSQILNKATNSGCDILWLVFYMDFIILGYLDITQNIILQNCQTFIKTLSIFKKKELTLS